MSDQTQTAADNQAETNQAKRFVLQILLVLIIMVIIGTISLFTGITSITHHPTASETTTVTAHHNLATRTVLTLVMAFNLVLIIGILRKSLKVWRAALALPISQTLMIGAFAWPQLDHTDPIGGVVVPMVIMFGIGL